MDMLHAASLFQISTLQQVCEKNFCENLSPQTCIAIWRIGVAYSCTRLAGHAWDYIIDNFKSVCRTEDFLELWESMHNPNFKPVIFSGFKDYRHRKKANPKIQEYISETGSIGIISKAGRYGGTFAHRDIAFEFASYVSPVFKLRIITEFQRLRSEEAQRNHLH